MSSIEVNCRFNVTDTCRAICPLPKSRKELENEVRKQIINHPRNAGQIITHANVSITCTHPRIYDSNYSTMQLICGAGEPTGEIYDKKNSLVGTIGMAENIETDEAA